MVIVFFFPSCLVTGQSCSNQAVKTLFIYYMNTASAQWGCLLCLIIWEPCEKLKVLLLALRNALWRKFYLWPYYLFLASQ